MTPLPLRAMRLQDHGAQVRVRFGLHAEQENYRRSRGLPVPEPVELLALLDTGASFTVLPPGTFRRLGVPAAGTAMIQVADGDRRERPSSPGRLHFRGTGAAVSFPTHAVEARHLGSGSSAIVGRDILSHGRFVYDGREGMVALVLGGIEVPVLDPLDDPGSQDGSG